jgi:hypothetical protein
MILFIFQLQMEVNFKILTLHHCYTSKCSIKNIVQNNSLATISCSTEENEMLRHRENLIIYYECKSMNRK